MTDKSGTPPLDLIGVGFGRLARPHGADCDSFWCRKVAPLPCARREVSVCARLTSLLQSHM